MDTVFPYLLCYTISLISKRIRIQKYRRRLVMRNVEKNIILDEIKKELNWKERIIVQIFKETCIHIYCIAGKIILSNLILK